jgi:hypothetical protein
LGSQKARQESASDNLSFAESTPDTNHGERFTARFIVVAEISATVPDYRQLSTW